MSSQNTFTQFLEQLNVKHTRYYANKLFNEHPNKYDLFGLSDMLTNYGIENAGFKVEQKEDICTAKPPFIAYAGGDFVVVDAINPQKTVYIWNGKRIAVATDEFFKIWSGVVLMAEVTEKSEEPDYRRHKRAENIDKAKSYAVVLIIAAIFVFACVSTQLYTNVGLLLLLLLNITGVGIGYLLLLKHLHVRGGYADKVCSLFKQTDCNNILESDAASVLGIISWSEIGLGYFVSNVAIILFFPHLTVWMALINVFALPYSFWSIWYQAIKARQWCPLCVMVQALLWLVFFVNMGFGFMGVPFFDLLQMGITACIYLIPLLTLHLLAPVITNKRRIEQITQEMNSLKANEKVFVILLEEQPRYYASQEHSQVMLGSPAAKLFVTVLTNPHCNPCADMHMRIRELLKLHKPIQVQYIFSSFSSELEISARYLIAVYLQKSVEEREHIYSEWFKKGKFNKEVFFEKYPADVNSIAVTEEFNRHQAWIQVSQLRATPTLLVNGYKLPDSYKIEDMKYFIDLEFEI